MRILFITIITLVLIILCIILVYTIRKTVFKPIEFNVIAGIIVCVGTTFLVFGKYLQDSGSSEKSDKIIQGISDISNPIPSNFDFQLNGQLEFSINELNEIRKIMVANQTGNTLPFDDKTNNEHYEKINRLKNVLFHLLIVIEKNGKIITMKYDQKIINYFSYNTTNLKNAFFLTLTDKINFSIPALSLKTEANYLQKTLNDFKNANITIKYAFLFPTKSGFYIDNEPNYYNLKIDDINLTHENNLFEVKSLKKISNRKYSGIISF